MILSKPEIESLIDENKLVIRPLLSRESQISDSSIDFRLGCDFFVTIQTREAYINASPFSKSIDHNEGDPARFFQETRRKIGDAFLLHPNQTVLASSLEYFKLPNDVVGILSMRSTYARLGLSLSSTVQSGYCGCFSLELINNSRNTIQVTVGSLLFQICLVKITTASSYFSKPRKYYCQVRPLLPAVNDEKELLILEKFYKQYGSSDY